MEKLRKIGQWVWLNKERMVFLVMVVILCWRVYIVVSPPEDEDAGPDITSPSAAGQMDVPQLPPTPNPLSVTPPPTAPLTRVDPFWYWSSQMDQEGEGEEGGVGIELESILPTPTGAMARLKTKGGRARAYREGEQFENYIVRRIDADAGEVEVYDESTGDNIVLTTR